MKRVLPGLYTFTGLVVGRVYMIEDPDGLTIVDAGTQIAPRVIVRQLRAAGYEPSDVKRILVTHAHPDHVGGLPELKRLTGAQVWASRADRPAIEGQERFAIRPRSKAPLPLRWVPTVYWTMKPTLVDRELSEGDVLPEVMGGLHVLSTPGHTPGHLSFWQPEKRVLFCGDVFVCGLWLRLPATFYTVDMDENRRSVRRLVALNPKVVCFGHGAPMRRNTARKIQRFASRACKNV